MMVPQQDLGAYLQRSKYVEMLIRSRRGGIWMVKERQSTGVFQSQLDTFIQT